MDRLEMDDKYGYGISQSDGKFLVIDVRDTSDFKKVFELNLWDVNETEGLIDYLNNYVYYKFPLDIQLINDHVYFTHVSKVSENYNSNTNEIIIVQYVMFVSRMSREELTITNTFEIVMPSKTTTGYSYSAFDRFRVNDDETIMYVVQEEILVILDITDTENVVQLYSGVYSNFDFSYYYDFGQPLPLLITSNNRLIITQAYQIDIINIQDPANPLVIDASSINLSNQEIQQLFIALQETYLIVLVFDWDNYDMRLDIYEMADLSLDKTLYLTYNDYSVLLTSDGSRLFTQTQGIIEKIFSGSEPKYQQFYSEVGWFFVNQPNQNFLLVQTEKGFKFQRVDYILEQDEVAECFRFDSLQFRYDVSEDSIPGATFGGEVFIRHFDLLESKFLTIKSFGNQCEIWLKTATTQAEVLCNYADLQQVQAIEISSDKTKLYIFASQSFVVRSLVTGTFMNEIISISLPVQVQSQSDPIVSYPYRLVLNEANNLAYLVISKTNILQVYDLDQSAPQINEIDCTYSCFVSDDGKLIIEYQQDTGTLIVYNGNIKPQDLATSIGSYTLRKIKGYQAYMIIANPENPYDFYMVERDFTKQQQSNFNNYFRKFIRITLNTTDFSKDPDVQDYQIQYKMIHEFYDPYSKLLYLMDFVKVNDDDTFNINSEEEYRFRIVLVDFSNFQYPTNLGYVQTNIVYGLLTNYRLIKSYYNTDSTSLKFYIYYRDQNDDDALQSYKIFRRSKEQQIIALPINTFENEQAPPPLVGYDTEFKLQLFQYSKEQDLYRYIIDSFKIMEGALISNTLLTQNSNDLSLYKTRKLPSYIYFDTDSGETQITSSKLSYGEKLVLLRCSKKLSYTEMPEDENTPDFNAYGSFKELQMLGFVDQDGYVTESFDYEGGFNLVQDSRHNLKLKNYVQSHTFEVVSRIFINTSLVISAEEGNLFFWTPSDQLISLTITLNKTQKTKFISDDSLYPKAKISEDGQKFEIQDFFTGLESIMNVIRIEQNFSPETVANFIVNDQLNPILNTSIKGIETCLTPNRAPTVGRSLQEQFFQIAIGTEFEFAFAQDTFIDLDTTDVLTYEATGLPELLQFISAQRMIKGKVDSMDNLQIKITASDPHGGSVSQEMRINVVPSFSYVLRRMLEVAGPLVSVISAIRYRYLIYLYFFKKKYIDYKVQQVRVGEKYTKKLPVIGDKIQRANQHLQKLEKRKKSENPARKHKIWLMRYYPSDDENGYLSIDSIKDLKQKPKSEGILVNRRKIIEDLWQIDENPKKIPAEILDSVITQQLLKQHRATKKILKALRTYREDLIRDWYKDFVEIDSTGEGYYPDIRIKEDVLQERLRQLSKLSKYKKLKYDNQLLRDGLITYARGIKQYTSTDLIYSAGVSLHVQNYQIQQITYKNVIPENSQLKKFFKLNHQKVVLEGNRMLPAWINFTLINDLILIEGVPSTNDTGLIVLQVEDINKLVIMEWYLDIKGEGDSEKQSPLDMYEKSINKIYPIPINNPDKNQPSYNQEAKNSQNNSNIMNPQNIQIQYRKNHNQHSHQDSNDIFTHLEILDDLEKNHIQNREIN